jgi:hypothetical protein
VFIIHLLGIIVNICVLSVLCSSTAYFSVYVLMFPTWVWSNTATEIFCRKVNKLTHWVQVLCSSGFKSLKINLNAQSSTKKGPIEFTEWGYSCISLHFQSKLWTASVICDSISPCELLNYFTINRMPDSD